MRILFIYDGISPLGGGSQLAIFTWIRNLLELGVKVKLVCNEYGIPQQEGLSKDNLIINPSLNLSWLYPNTSLSISLSSKTLESIRLFNPDIIHLHEPSILSYKMLQHAKRRNIPTLMSFHTNYKKGKVSTFPLSLIWTGKNGIANIVIGWLQSYLLRQADFITAPSHVFQKLLKETYEKEIFVLFYPISQIFFSKKTVSSKRFKLLSVSRLSGEKNIDVLIKMVQYLDDSFELTIVGDGVDKPYLTKLVSDLKLKSRIHFYGPKTSKEIAKIFDQYDIFVSSSSYETFGITYIEALASKIPCFVYDYATSREVIPNNMAIFINSLDPKIWAEKLSEIQKNPELYNNLKSNIEKDYKEVEKYNEIESTKRLIEIYKQILPKQ